MPPGAAPRFPSILRLLAALLLAGTLAATACRPGVPDTPAGPAEAQGEGATQPAAGDDPATAPATPAGTAPPHSPGPTVAPDADRAPGQAGRGVTAEPCPAAVNPGNGCLYLGALEDLGRADLARRGSAGGDLARLGTASSEARAAFWQRVNARGGLAGYDVDATTYTRDSGARADRAALALAETRSEVLALAASQGTGATAAILPSLRETGMAAVATTATSTWAGTGHVVTVGASACVDAANGVDHVLGDAGAGGVAVVHQAGTFGEDAAAGAALAAGRRGSPLSVLALPEPAAGPGAVDAGALDAAAAGVLEAAPRVAVVAAGAGELEALAGRLSARGFGGTVVALAAGWDERLAARLPPPAAARLLVAGPWAPWGSRTPGHAALRAALEEALGDDLEPREAHVAGWVRQYPLVAALEAAAEAGAPAPGDVLRALDELDAFGSDGMLPGAGAGAPAAAHSVLSAVDPGAPTGLAARTGHVAGATARALDLTEPCPRP